MKRIITWLIIVSLTFCFGVIATLIYLPHSAPVIQNPSNTEKEDIAVELPAVSYCELASQVEKYTGKIVRVRALLTGGMHGLSFRDADCPRAEQAAVILNHQDEEEFIQNLKEASRSNKFNSDKFNIGGNLIAVGRFKMVIPTHASDALVDTASLQFEIMHIEKGSKLH